MCMLKVARGVLTYLIAKFICEVRSIIICDIYEDDVQYVHVQRPAMWANDPAPTLFYS